MARDAGDRVKYNFLFFIFSGVSYGKKRTPSTQLLEDDQHRTTADIGGTVQSNIHTAIIKRRTRLPETDNQRLPIQPDLNTPISVNTYSLFCPLYT